MPLREVDEQVSCDSLDFVLRQRQHPRDDGTGPRTSERQFLAG